MSVGAGALQVGRPTKRSLEEEEGIHVSPASGHHQNWCYSGIRVKGITSGFFFGGEFCTHDILTGNDAEIPLWILIASMM